ncbi:MAG: polysaccharide deacetylase [Candidatus Poribacteria bacterium]|nr:MAG: polysaccharide deacetylase [Candidatus Poribacteria bacterium]
MVPIVLAYHRVGARRGIGISHVTPSQLEDHLDALEDWGYRLGTLDEVLAELIRPSSSERTVLLTFDDGTADFLEHAWPVLRRWGARPVLFPVVGFLGRSNRWDPAPFRTRHLTWKELQHLAAEGVEIGAHSVTHPFLAHSSSSRVRREVYRSKVLLEERLGVSVRAFAYPYGDWSPEVAATVAQAGFEVAFTMDPFLPATPENRFSLPRVGIYRMDGRRRLGGKLGQLGDRTRRRLLLEARWINRCSYAGRLFRH